MLLHHIKWILLGLTRWILSHPAPGTNCTELLPKSIAPPRGPACPCHSVHQRCHKENMIMYTVSHCIQGGSIPVLPGIGVQIIYSGIRTNLGVGEFQFFHGRMNNDSQSVWQERLVSVYLLEYYLIIVSQNACRVKELTIPISSTNRSGKGSIVI